MATCYFSFAAAIPYAPIDLQAEFDDIIDTDLTNSIERCVESKRSEITVGSDKILVKKSIGIDGMNSQEVSEVASQWSNRLIFGPSDTPWTMLDVQCDWSTTYTVIPIPVPVPVHQLDLLF